MNQIDVVRDISRRFEQAQIRYMLTGSMAMNYYFQPRMRRDIDLVVAKVSMKGRISRMVNDQQCRGACPHAQVQA